MLAGAMVPVRGAGHNSQSVSAMLATRIRVVRISGMGTAGVIGVRIARKTSRLTCGTSCFKFKSLFLGTKTA